MWWDIIEFLGSLLINFILVVLGVIGVILMVGSIICIPIGLALGLSGGGWGLLIASILVISGLLAVFITVAFKYF